MNVRRWWTRCGRFEPWLSLRALGRLGDAEAAVLAAHLERCPACRARAEAAEQTAGALRNWALDPGPVVVPSTLRDRWVRAVRASAEGGAGGDTPVPDRVRDRRDSRPAGGERWAWGAVAAAWALVALLHATAPAPVPVPAAGGHAGTAVAWKTLMLVLRGAPGAGPEDSEGASPGPGPDRGRRDSPVPQGRWEPRGERTPAV